MQHLQIAQMRALETGRYMLRATNTGMTAVVDPRGNVVAVAASSFQTVLTQRKSAATPARRPCALRQPARALALLPALAAAAFLRGNAA
jgi:apolipoprotein N-acyltransferase